MPLLTCSSLYAITRADTNTVVRAVWKVTEMVKVFEEVKGHKAFARTSTSRHKVRGGVAVGEAEGREVCVQCLCVCSACACACAYAPASSASVWARVAA